MAVDYDLIILVIASHGPIYDHFHSVWKKYDGRHERIKVFYVYKQQEVGPGTATGLIAEDTIVIDTPDLAFSGILFKTMAAISIIESRYSYKYLLRTNLSSFFRLGPLHQHLLSLPATHVWEGNCGESVCGDDFVSGAGMLMSRDVVQTLLLRQAELDHNTHEDDVAISLVLTKWQIPMKRTANRYELIGNRPDDVNKGIFQRLPHFHFRIKYYAANQRMIYDKYAIDLLYQTFYEN